MHPVSSGHHCAGPVCATLPSAHFSPLPGTQPSAHLCGAKRSEAPSEPPVVAHLEHVYFQFPSDLLHAPRGCAAPHTSHPSQGTRNGTATPQLRHPPPGWIARRRTEEKESAPRRQSGPRPTRSDSDAAPNHTRWEETHGGGTERFQRRAGAQETFRILDGRYSNNFPSYPITF